MLLMAIDLILPLFVSFVRTFECICGEIYILNHEGHNG